MEIVGEMQDLRYGFSVSRPDPISEGNPEKAIRRFCCQSPRDVRFGSKADIRAAKSYVRFAPKADICSAQAYVRFGPRADMTPLKHLSLYFAMVGRGPKGSVGFFSPMLAACRHDNNGPGGHVPGPPRKFSYPWAARF